MLYNFSPDTLLIIMQCLNYLVHILKMCFLTTALVSTKAETICFAHHFILSS